MKKSIFTYFSAFILLGLILIKVTSFHIYSHQDNPVDTIENCSICDMAIQNQNSEFTFITILAIVFFSVSISTDQKIYPLAIELPSSYFSYASFGRPPPSFM